MEERIEVAKPGFSADEQSFHKPSLRPAVMDYTLQFIEKPTPTSILFCLNHNFPGNSYCHIMSKEGSILSTASVNHIARGDSTQCLQVYLTLPSSIKNNKISKAYIQCESMNPYEREGFIIIIFIH